MLGVEYDLLSAVQEASHTLVDRTLSSCFSKNQRDVKPKASLYFLGKGRCRALRADAELARSSMNLPVRPEIRYERLARGCVLRTA